MSTSNGPGLNPCEAVAEFFKGLLERAFPDQDVLFVCLSKTPESSPETTAQPAEETAESTVEMPSE